MGLLVPDLARFFGYSVDMLSLGLLWVPRAVRAVVGDCLAPRKLLCGLARLSVALFLPARHVVALALVSFCYAMLFGLPVHVCGRVRAAFAAA